VATVRPPKSQTAQTMRIRCAAVDLERGEGGTDLDCDVFRDEVPVESVSDNPSASAASAAARNSRRLSVRRAMEKLISINVI
jgi:hypothetical protein